MNIVSFGNFYYSAAPPPEFCFCIFEIHALSKTITWKIIKISEGLINFAPSYFLKQTAHSLKNRTKIDDFVMMCKIPANKVSIEPAKFFDGVLTTSARGKQKLRVSVAKTRIRSDFLTYRTPYQFNLLLGRYEDLRWMSVYTCRRFIQS